MYTGDSASNSEIVVPIFDPTGELRGIIDIDCPVKNGFNEQDQQGIPFAAICLYTCVSVIYILSPISLISSFTLLTISRTGKDSCLAGGGLRLAPHGLNRGINYAPTHLNRPTIDNAINYFSLIFRRLYIACVAQKQHTI